MTQREECGCGSQSENPSARALQPAKTCPLEAREQYQRRNEDGESRTRQEEQRGKQRRDQDDGRADPLGELAYKLTFQATSARLVASSCSLVRPKRRSRLRYEVMARSSAAASKSGHSVSVK